MYEKVRLKYAPQKSTVKGKDFFDVNFFLQPDSRPLFYQFIAELKESCSQAEPTPTHHFLKDLAKEGRLTRWYTQNIDCLEERLGLNCWTTATECAASSTVVSLHGTLSQVTCTLCKVTTSFTDEHLDLFKSGKELPCKSCSEVSELRESLGKRKLRSGYLRPDIVLYNEPHPHGETIADFVSADMAKQPNLLIVMGTSLKIAGLKKMIKDFAKNMKSRVGGENNLIVYVNKTPCSRAEWQNVFDYELIGECDQWVKFLGDEFAKIKRFPKSTAPRVLIPSSPIKLSTPANTATSATVSSPKQKKKKSIPISAQQSMPKAPIVVDSKAAEISEISITPVPTATSSPLRPSRRIDEFFTPVKGSTAFSSRLANKAKKIDSIAPEPATSDLVPKTTTTRRVKKSSGLAM